jgi:hypothetical protein
MDCETKARLFPVQNYPLKTIAATKKNPGDRKHHPRQKRDRRFKSRRSQQWPPSTGVAIVIR